MNERKNLLRQKLLDAKKHQDNFHYWPNYYRYFPPVECKEALKKENRSKNHCLHYAYPFDHNQITSIPHYINASPMKLGRHHYIASQGPRKNTFEEFWKMIWWENVDLIVSVTNEKEDEGVGIVHKFDAFWPKKEENFGAIEVAMQSEEVLKSWENCIEKIVRRNMRVGFQDNFRALNHLHMENWMDGDIISPNSLIALRETADFCNSNGTILVHCAAGIGRTGTFIAFHSLYHDMCRFLEFEEEEFDVAKRVLEMRTKRYGPMIAERRQYGLVVEALELVLEAL